jgi:Xaa-Pro aminopeptidase
MRYQALSSDFYRGNRKKFIEKIDSSSFAIFHSNDTMPTNADGTMGFRQNNDLFYLCGIDQEETTLVVDSRGYETLFIRETSDLIKIWEGAKLTKEEASILSGIEDVRWYAELDTFLKEKFEEFKTIFVSNNEHTRADSPVESRNTRLNKALPDDLIKKSSAPILHQLRYIKSKEEIAQIQKACNITKKAFDRVLKFIKPNDFEFEVEAEITHEFTINRSRGHAYQPIIASGANACVLHYIENNAVCKAGDLVLMDFGAEYGNYNADLTRTIPVNGRFSPRQKQVYEAVLRVHNFAKNLLIPGNTFEILNKEVGLFMQNELINLGLLNELDVKNQNPDKPLFRKYFMHGTSHSLGLDVHDVDDRSLPFAEGMVFTCEPGIYIPEENIGIRIENDFYLTKNGNIDLMANIPITVEEIEEMMKR